MKQFCHFHISDSLLHPAGEEWITISLGVSYLQGLSHNNREVLQIVVVFKKDILEKSKQKKEVFNKMYRIISLIFCS